MRSVSYQRKVGDLFFPELLVLITLQTPHYVDIDYVSFNFTIYRRHLIQGYGLLACQMSHFKMAHPVYLWVVRYFRILSIYSSVIFFDSPSIVILKIYSLHCSFYFSIFPTKLHIFNSEHISTLCFCSSSVQPAIEVETAFS
jgi:hypothetical protein